MAVNEIDKERCLANLYLLAKKKKIAIKDLETMCGVSIGYLARLRLDKRQVLPGSDFLFSASAVLGESVDSLVYFDFRLATEREQYLHSFMKELMRDSLKQKIVWDLDPDCIPSPVVHEGKALFPDHPLLSLDPNLLQQGRSKEIYLSPFHPNEYNLIPRAAWRAALSEDVVVYLIKAAAGSEDAPASPESSEAIDLYLYNKSAKMLSPLCSVNPEHPNILYHDLAELFETVSDLLHYNGLDQYAIDAIDAYMAGR